MPKRRVLLTGAYSLTGSHILHQLLSSDVSVRAVVGSRDESEAIRSLYAQHNSTLLDFAIVSPRDCKTPGTYNEALKRSSEPFDTIIHTVTANLSKDADCLSRFINLETENLLRFLADVKENAIGVQRVVLTTFLSPFARWLVGPQLDRSAYQRSSSSQSAVEVDSDYILATSQASSNIVNEQLCKWTKAVGAKFDLISITAPSIYGPSIRFLSNSTDLEDANRRIWNICNNDPTDEIRSPPFGIEYFADVRDFAFAHVQAVFIPEAGNRQFTISAGTVLSRVEITEFLRSHFPEVGARPRTGHSTPNRVDSKPADHTLRANIPHGLVDTSPAATTLGLVQYRPFERTLTDLVPQILELNRRREWRRVVQS